MTPYVRWGDAPAVALALRAARRRVALAVASAGPAPDRSRFVRRDDAGKMRRFRTGMRPPAPMLTFQQVILSLQDYWDRAGLRAAAALRHGGRRGHVAHGDLPARARPRAVARRLRAAVAPPEGRPLRREPEPDAALLPVPGGAEALAARTSSTSTWARSRRWASTSRKNDVRFVEDDWENPTLGAWGLGWEVWLNGMEVTQFTYFQQVGGLDCNPITGEITYGLERLAMYLQGKENVFDLVWTSGRSDGATRRLTYGDVYHQNEVEQSTYNFEQANAPKLFELFAFFESRGEAPARGEAGAAGLRDDPQGRAHVQPARRARRDLGDRARRLHRPHPHAVAARRAGLRRLARGARLPDAARRTLARTRACMERQRPTLLVELLTEELPPKALQARWARRSPTALVDGLRERGFLTAASVATPYATPRRLAVSDHARAAPSPDEPVTQKLMPASVALDADGQAHGALQQEARRARPRRTSPTAGRTPVDGPDRLLGESDGKADALFCTRVARGSPLAARACRRRSTTTLARAADPEGDELRRRAAATTTTSGSSVRRTGCSRCTAPTSCR